MIESRDHGRARIRLLFGGFVALFWLWLGFSLLMLQGFYYEHTHGTPRPLWVFGVLGLFVAVGLFGVVAGSQSALRTYDLLHRCLPADARPVKTERRTLGRTITFWSFRFRALDGQDYTLFRQGLYRNTRLQEMGAEKMHREGGSEVVLYHRDDPVRAVLASDLPPGFELRGRNMIDVEPAAPTVAYLLVPLLVVGVNLGVLLGAGPHAVQASDWPQFGGPDRDFTVDSPPLIDEWPEQGPTTIWSRPLGPGNAAITATGDVLYTLYGSPGSETVVALSAEDGSTLWEHRYPVRLPEGMNLEQSAGPHATPLVHEDLLITVGVAGTLVALERATGEPVWTRELIHEEGGTPVFRGYSSSPVAWGDTVILPVGGEGRAVMAFRVDDGAVVWSRQDFVNANASPILGTVDGVPQLIALMVNVVAGLDPVNGDLLWRLPVPQRFGEMISTPVLGDDGLLFCSVPHDGGSRVIEIAATAEDVTAEELWQHRDLRLYYTNAVRIGDWVYGSSGDLGPTFFTAVNVHTGEVAWRSRELMRSNFIHANGRLILRDEEGRLTMARVSPEGLEVLAQAEMFEPGPPVAPSLVEGRLYVRDAERIAAIDLRAVRE